MQKSWFYLIVVLMILIFSCGDGENSNSLETTMYYEDVSSFLDEELRLAMDPKSNCCNNEWPSYTNKYPNEDDCAYLNYCLGGPMDSISCVECAILWSEFNNNPSGDLSHQACNEIVPDKPRAPAWITGSLSGDHPKLDWGFVYTHKTQVQRKIGNGSWIGIDDVDIHLSDGPSWGDSTYTDTNIDLDMITVNHYYRVKSLVYTSTLSNASSIIKYEEPLVVNIDGPTSLTTLQTGTFEAEVVGGLPNYTYEWWKFQYCDDPPKDSDDSKAPPCGSWVKLSETSSTLVKGGVEPGFRLKVIVDDQESESDTDYHYVSVSAP